jgi:hypothetical protein
MLTRLRDAHDVAFRQRHSDELVPSALIVRSARPSEIAGVLEERMSLGVLHRPGFGCASIE